MPFIAVHRSFFLTDCIIEACRICEYRNVGRERLVFRKLHPHTMSVECLNIVVTYVNRVEWSNLLHCWCHRNERTQARTYKHLLKTQSVAGALGVLRKRIICI